MNFLKEERSGKPHTKLINCIEKNFQEKEISDILSEFYKNIKKNIENNKLYDEIYKKLLKHLFEQFKQKDFHIDKDSKKIKEIQEILKQPLEFFENAINKINESKLYSSVLNLGEIEEASKANHELKIINRDS